MMQLPPPWFIIAQAAAEDGCQATLTNGLNSTDEVIAWPSWLDDLIVVEKGIQGLDSERQQSKRQERKAICISPLALLK
jgi:hypothetical protein